MARYGTDSPSFRFLRKSSFFVLPLFFMLPVFGFGQGAAPGLPSFSSWHGEVDLSNLNVLIDVPVRNKTGAIPFAYHLTENNGFAPNLFLTPRFLPSSVVNRGLGSVTHKVKCPDGVTWTWVQQAWRLIDVAGTIRSFPSAIVDTQGCIYGTTYTDTTSDNSGYVLYANANGGSYLTDVAGNTIYPGASFADPNGNSITSGYSSGPPVSYPYTDTLGQNALTWTLGTIGGGAGTPDQFTYTDSSGTPRTVQVNYSSVTQRTAFGCPPVGPPDIGPTATYFPTSISLPDGSSYLITYETTPGYPSNYTGRIASITLPTGATISYAYSGGNNGLNCVDGTAAAIKKTTPDGIWTYTCLGSA